MKPPVREAKPPIGSDAPVTLYRSSAVRVLDATRRVEGMRVNVPPDRRGRPGGGGGGGGMLAVLSGSLANATSATAPTSATAVFRTFSGGTIGTGSVSVTVRNYHNKTFASGALVFISYALGAWWVIDARDCPT